MSSAVDIDRIARVVLAIAGVSSQSHSSVIGELFARLDKDAARRRRDIALREARDILRAAGGSVELLSVALARYRANTWPTVRHLPEPPAGPHLAICYWRACRAAEDAGIGLPGYRQLRRIVE